MLIMKYAYVAKIYNMECANLQNSTLGDNICQGYIRPNTLPPLCNNPDSRPFLFSLLPSLPLFQFCFIFYAFFLLEFDGFYSLRPFSK